MAVNLLCSSKYFYGEIKLTKIDVVRTLNAVYDMSQFPYAENNTLIMSKVNWIVFFVTDVNECVSNPCQYNGTCRDNLGYYTCRCPEYRTGNVCQYGERFTTAVLFAHASELFITEASVDRLVLICDCKAWIIF